MCKNLKIVFAIGFAINILVGCSGSENVTLRKYEAVEKLRGQPGEIYVRTTDSQLYLFLHSNYHIQNDTLFGNGYLLTNEQEIVFEGEFILSNIISVQYEYSHMQEIELYYSPEQDSLFVEKKTGAEIFIALKDGTKYIGELLSVQDSIIILCDEYDVDEEELVDSVYSIYVVKNREINLIELLEDHSNTLGIILGGTTGFLIGGAIGRKTEDVSNYEDPNEFHLFTFKKTPSSSGNLLTACIGLVLGGVIGGVISSSSTENELLYQYNNAKDFDFKSLSIYTRYGSEKPEYLKNIK